MKIEHTIRRQGGTVIDMPPTETSPHGASYHFKPEEDDPRHVASVEDKAHLKRFLGIDTFDVADAEGVKPRGAVAGTDGGGHGGAAVQTPANPDEDKPQQDADAGDRVADEDLEMLTDEEIADLYEKELGKKPRANAATATLISQIRAKRAEK